MTAGFRRATLPQSQAVWRPVMAIMASMVSSEPGSARATFRSPALALVLAALFWSGNFVAGRALRGHVDPVTLNFLRWLIALALIAPFVWRSTAASLPVLRREWRLILTLGATGIASFHTLVYLALQSTTATSALLMLSLAPIVTLLASAAVGMEHPTNRQIGGALISIVGAGVLITRGNLTGILSQGFNVGDLWMLLAVVIWAAYSLLLRRRPADLPSPVALAASIAAALAMMVPVLILSAPTPVAALGSFPVLLSIAYIAIFASAIAFLFWTYGVSRLGPTRAGQFVNLMPIFGAGLAFSVLGEVPTLAQVAGAALVLSGIAFVEGRARKRHPATAKEPDESSFGPALRAYGLSHILRHLPLRHRLRLQSRGAQDHRHRYGGGWRRRSPSTSS
jgi:drug/metabolite transporter (DMT)-like permease